MSMYSKTIGYKNQATKILKDEIATQIVCVLERNLYAYSVFFLLFEKSIKNFNNYEQCTPRQEQASSLQRDLQYQFLRAVRNFMHAQQIQN